MLVQIKKASDYRYEKIVNFRTLEDLFKFIEEKANNHVIIGKMRDTDIMYYVMIYDDYVE